MEPPARADTRPVALAECISRDFLLYHRFCPLHELSSGELAVAVGEDFVEAGLDDLAIAYQRPVQTIGVSAAELAAHIERLTTAAERRIELARTSVSDVDGPEADVRDLANQPPVIRYVNLLVRDAYDAGASDVHLEATRSGLTARFRLDGVLVPAPEAPAALHHAIVSRVKLLAELDISERRRPQDGRIRVRMESRELDLRVSTVPTMHGESVVLRLLDRGGRPVQLYELGMSADVLESLSTVVTRPHGLVLVTGPTGSGKTTTLYAALGCRDGRAEKIITVEDPIEYQLEAVTQMPVHRQAGVTFASALRAILRQDPDVVMIGEMRDAETAEIGIQAAMTGHLVLSTLHTNDAVSAVPRLLDLGVPAYLVAATVDGILAQRLVRRNCQICRVTYAPSAEAIRVLGEREPEPLTLTRGAGCPNCRGTGFRGRLGIFEFIRVTDELRDAITHEASRLEVRQIVERAGFASMRADGWSKVRQGLTTVEEVLRVVQE